MNDQRYPLAWPSGWKRTPYGQRKTGVFKSRGSWINVEQATYRLEEELKKLKATQAVLSTNMSLTLRGVPRSSDRPTDPGIAVYFKLKDRAQVLACDAYIDPASNIAAIAAHIDALRRIDRYGVGTIEQAFAGYTAIGHAAGTDWHLELAVEENASLEEIELGYRRKVRAVNETDPTGLLAHEQLVRLNTAVAAARKARA